jgi:ubiquinone/menaquinone biosynthesis C-methylase UbiE
MAALVQTGQMNATHHDRVREQFRLQAPTFTRTGFAANGLEWIVAQLAPQPDQIALDVAAGAAHLGRALAPLVTQVAAIDLTPEMLIQGHHLAEESGLSNITFQVGDAGRLPWIDGQFDLVVCRLAVHQVADPGTMVREMLRVTRPGGRVGITDIFVAEPQTAEETNRLERLRDPSHSRTRTREEIVDLVDTAGGTVISEATTEFALELDDWLERTHTSETNRKQIVARFEQEIAGGSETGLRPARASNGTLFLTHPWITVIATPGP